LTPATPISTWDATEHLDDYRDGSVLTFAESLRGDLLVVHDMIDDNVHFPIQALIDAGSHTRR
jgi:dipeptidyl aminopeptidase/acylaminoacyl peptidase